MPKITEKDYARKFIIEFINVYHSLPALWDVKSNGYRNRNKKNEQYKLLIEKYRERYPNASKEDVIRKINSLRTNFRKEFKRIQEIIKCGGEGGCVVEPNLWYYKELGFIAPHEEHFSTQNSFHLEKSRKDEGNNSTIDSNFEEHSWKKSKQVDETQELLLLARKSLEETSNDYEKISSAWAVELQRMEPQQQIFAKKAINDILFEGQMGTLHRGSVQINRSRSRTSSPFSVSSSHSHSLYSSETPISSQ